MLPASGTVYLDADALIYTVERIAPYWTLLEPLWHAAQVGTFVVLSSELALLETLIKPLRDADTLLLAAYRTTLRGSRETRLVPIDAAVLERAAALRAVSAIKTPDAIHAATALVHASTLFVTNDPGYRRVPALPLAVLDDLLAP